MFTFRKLPLHFKALQAYTSLYSAFAVNYHSLIVPLPYHFVNSRRRPWISGREVVGMSYNSMQDILFQNSIVIKAEWILCWGMYCSRLGAGIWISGWYCSLCKLAPAAPNRELLLGDVIDTVRLFVQMSACLQAYFYGLCATKSTLPADLLSIGCLRNKL